VVTVPDAVRARYRSPAAQGICAVALLIATVGYVATNLLALGHVLNAIAPISVPEGTVIGTAIVLAYSATGGILAGVRTDVFQGAVKAIASVLVFVAVMRQGVGLGGITHTILAHDPALLGPWGTMTPLAALSLFFVFGVGTLGQPHVISKYYMLRDPLKLRWYPLLMTLVLLITLLLFFSFGLGVKAAVLGGSMPPLKVADDATPAFLLTRTSPWLAAIVLSGIVAASMGIVNAFLNVAAAALTHDIPAALNRPLSDELTYGRLATLVVALVALAVAIQSGAVVALLGIFGWGLFAATLVPSLAIGLNWKGASRAAAIASMATGLAVTILFELFNRFSGHHTPPSISAAGVELLLAILVFFVVSWCTPAGAARDLDPDIARIMSG
jgi:Na+/proline symporter